MSAASIHMDNLAHQAGKRLRKFHHHDSHENSPLSHCQIYYQHMKQGAVRFHSIFWSFPIRDLPGLLIQTDVAFVAAWGNFSLGNRLPHGAALFLDMGAALKAA